MKKKKIFLMIWILMMCSQYVFAGWGVQITSDGSYDWDAESNGFRRINLSDILIVPADNNTISTGWYHFYFGGTMMLYVINESLGNVYNTENMYTYFQSDFIVLEFDARLSGDNADYCFVLTIDDDVRLPHSGIFRSTILKDMWHSSGTSSTYYSEFGALLSGNTYNNQNWSDGYNSGYEPVFFVNTSWQHFKLLVNLEKTVYSFNRGGARAFGFINLNKNHEILVKNIKVYTVY